MRNLPDLIHHDGSALYVSEPAPALGGTVELRLRVPIGLAPAQVWLRTVADGEPRQLLATPAELTATEQWWQVQLQIRNPLTRYRWGLAGGNVGYGWLNAAGWQDHDVNDASDFAISTAPLPPAWARRAVVYQIFPDRFARSAHDYVPPAWAAPRDWDAHPDGRGKLVSKEWFGGDLWGVAEHIDQLAELGVDVIYTTPFFPAESTHRYDAQSFDQVDPLLGGDAALIQLAEVAHARGMRVMGDITLNHTGVTHEWFAAAQRGEQPHADFYTFDAALPHGYECWFGVRTLPKLNYRSLELREEFIAADTSVIKKWLQPPFNLDGWRIDVGNMTGRQADLDVTEEVARLTNHAMREVSAEKLLVAEHFHDAGPDLAGDGWHGVMNYSAFLRPVWSWLVADSYDGNWLGIPTPVPRTTAAQLVATIRSFASRMPWRSYVHSWSLLGSHDTARVRSVVGSAERQHVAAALLFTLPGTPMVFAGDELGALGLWGEDSRTTYPWNRPNEWDHQTLAVYRELIALRKRSDALAAGGLRWLHAEADALAFLRETANERLLVLVARAAQDEIELPMAQLAATNFELVSGQAPQLVDGNLRFTTAAAAFGIVRLLD